MLWALRQIVTPICYLRIRQGETTFKSKAVYDWILPFLITIPTVFLSVRFEGSAGIFTDGGLIGGFLKLLEIMVPFFIAALAAVATFSRKGLDSPLKGAPAFLKRVRADGVKAEYQLTRREFVCYLFGYLAFMALTLFVVILFLRIISAGSGEFFDELLGNGVWYCKLIVSLIVYFFIWQMIIATFLGIYFMSDRLQTMDDPSV